MQEEAAQQDAAAGAAALTMPNPFIDTQTLEEAEESAGFSITLPESGEEIGTLIYRAMPEQMIEVIYLDEEDSELYRIRKGKNMEEDISGMWYETAFSKVMKAGELEITLTGEVEDQWDYAAWTEKTEDGAQYSYAITARDNALSEEDFLRMAEEMNG